MINEEFARGGKQMRSYVLGFQDVDITQRMVVGGKGANLGELSRIEGICVPDGFCLATESFQRVFAETSAVHELLDQISLLTVEDRETIGELSAEIRGVIEAVTIPQDVREEIVRHLYRYGEKQAYAIRSSAPAEDGLAASFAGQQETFVNILGEQAILSHISKCWASLFTERAVMYRLHHGFDQRNVQLAVVVQQMVFAQAAGMVFTADPLTSNRKVVSIEASFGLGEAIVSGLVNPDRYTVRNGTILEKRISRKTRALSACKDGGTSEQEIKPERQTRQVLTDEQVMQLAGIGRTIEAHFGCPQDIEWCLADETFFLVQSRPITTLYPIPEAYDHENHVYISVGHQQMMTDPMKPLGLSIFQLTALRPMFAAGGRLFVDVTQELASPVSGARFVDGIGQHDPLIQDALLTILQRRDFIPLPPHDEQEQRPGSSTPVRPPAGVHAPAESDPGIVPALMKKSQASIEALQHTIRAQSGSAALDAILDDIGHLQKILLDPQSSGVWRAAFAASLWINEHMHTWLAERNVADTLSQSVPYNITSDMGLALLDVADALRPYPDVIAYLQQARDETFLDDLVQYDGGQAARDALSAFLHTYGMRCAGEIDLTRPRWSEKPTTLVPTILRNIAHFEPHASRRKYEQGLQDARKKEQEILDRVKRLPDGENKVRETQRMITILRNFTGYREYPKYSIVSRYFVYKQALLKEAEQLVQAGVLQEKADIFYLTFQELRDVVRTQRLDSQIISRRKDEYAFYEKLTPPRVITSDGEIIAGAYTRENLPAGALIGLPVSCGVIEGRARVVLHMDEADLGDGDILVTTFTDPSWTLLFVSIKGLITEVGGQMTHGAVIAREYGIPAVIGVEHATTRIHNGDRIRVNGTEGYVEILA